MRLRSTLVAAVAVATLTAACGGGSDDAAPKDTSAGTDASATSAKPARAELRFVVPSKIDDIDPLIASGVTEVQVLRLVTGTLFDLDYDGQGVTPGLAESGTFAPDDLSYTVTLAEGTTFADGTPLTSADVVASMERGLSFESNVYAGEFAPITEVVADDPSTVTFRFARAYPSFETMLSFPEFSILRAADIAADGTLAEQPTFAGAYAIEGDVHGNSYALVRNDAYAGDRPSVERLSFAVVPDASGRLAQVRGGQADFATDVGAQALGQQNPGTGTYAEPSMIITQLTFGVKSEPVSDPRIRQALSKALDRERISKIAWAGAMPPNAGLMPTGSLGAAPGDPKPDAEAARALLAGTACADGCRLSLLYDSSSEWQASTATIVEQNLKAVGIEVAVQPLETITLYERLGEGDFQLALGYFGAYADAPETTPQYCLSYSYGFLSCYTGYESAEAEEAVGRAVVATDEASLAAAYEEIEAIFQKDAPLATLTDYAAVWTVRDDAEGYASIGATAFVSIAPEKG